MNSLRLNRSLPGVSWLLILCTSTALAVGCGEDEEGGLGAQAGRGGSAGAAAGKGGNVASGGESLGGSPDGGTSAGGVGGAAVAGEPVVFEIPAGGGEVEVTLASGNSVSFDFPASASGTTITLTPSAASSVGWPDGHFDDVIEMTPDGLTFDDPVEIRSTTGSVLAFDYASSGEKSPAEGLALNANGDALLLTHFSTLVIVPPGVSCDSTSGWVETEDDQACSDHGTASSRLNFICKAYTYCLLIEASCCAEPGTEGCELGMDALTLAYTPADTNGGQFPYCDRNAGNGGAGGGPGAGGAGGAGGASSSGGSGGEQSSANPTLTSINPSTITAGSCPTTVELVGTNFDAAGSGFVNIDSAVTTVWNSATSATITIDSCLNPGTINSVGYVNPASGGGYDWPNRSNMQNITVEASGSCFNTGTEASPTGTGACNDPYVFTFGTADATASHTATSGGATWNASGSSCVSSPVRTDVYRVNPYQYSWNQIEVSVDAVTASDVKISFFDSDIACNVEDSCINAGGTAACEYGSATQSQLQTGAIFFAVTTSGTTDSVTTRVHVN